MGPFVKILSTFNEGDPETNKQTGTAPTLPLTTAFQDNHRGSHLRPDVTLFQTEIIF